MENSKTFSQLNLDIPEPKTATELSIEFKDEGIHPAFIETGIKFLNDQIIGSTARCVALLSACKKFIADYETPSNTVLNRDLEKKLEKNLVYLRKCRTFTEGMDTAVKYIKFLLPLITPKISEENAKAWLETKIDHFIKQKITKSQEFITAIGTKLIKEGDTILTFGRSHLVEAIIIKAREEGKNFDLIIADNPPFYEGKALVSRLSQLDIKSTYTLINSVPYFMKKVDKVFVGCSIMLSNGNVISRVGTAMLSCVAANYRTPFYAFCETYKFSDQNLLDAFGKNELNDPSKVTNEKNVDAKYKVMNLRYDMTPKENISMVVTEVGKLPPTSVPVIIREFLKNSYTGNIDPPQE